LNSFSLFFRSCRSRPVGSAKKIPELGELVAIDGSLIDAVLSMYRADYLWTPVFTDVTTYARGSVWENLLALGHFN